MRLLLVCLILTLYSLHGLAQRFYYLETNNSVDRLVKSQLQKSDQYVVPSVLGSDYTVRTKAIGKDDSRELSLEIILADSVTQQEIYRSYEQFCFTPGNAQPQLLYTIAIRSFLQRRIGEMMTSANQFQSGFFRELKPRKDKI